jgi:ABC-type nitrate/sulfonate/bicarbonate transport system ATPase subunit
MAHLSGWPELKETFLANELPVPPAAQSPERPDPAAIAVSDLWLTYPGQRDGEPIHVLQQIDFKVKAGEFVCIVGPSGCRKTTLLNIIGGFLAPTKGEILVESEPVDGPDPRRIVIFQA